MYLERKWKKITRPIHTPPQTTESWDKRMAQLLLVCALSVSPARNRWNKNKILLFLRKVLIFSELVERRTDIQGSIKINSCVPKLVLFCVQISTRVSPVTCYLQSLKFCSLRINSRANWNLNIFFIESLKCFLLKRLKHRQCITHIKQIFWILLSCNRVSPWYLNNWKII